MLGCQALTEAYNLGVEGKDKDSKHLLSLIDKHEDLLLKACASKFMGIIETVPNHQPHKAMMVKKLKEEFNV